MSVTPLHVGVEAVIRRPALVLIPQALLRGLLPLAVDLHDAPGAECHVRMDKDLQTVGRVLQDVVCAATHDDAGAFCAAATTNYKEEVLFTINYRTDLTTACVMRYRGVLYDITRIDTFEGYKEDLTLYCSRRARQN